MSDAQTSAAASPADGRAALQQALANEIVTVSRRWRARLDERLARVGQTMARYATLYWTAESPEGLTQTALAEQLGVEKPTLVRLLDALEAQQLLARSTAPGDRRAKVVAATDKAAAALESGNRIAAQLRDELFAGISDADLAVCGQVLAQLRERLARR